MALINQNDLEAKLGRSLTTEETSIFPLINEALQHEVESLIGSKVESVSETTRFYDGGVQHLAIDPCTNITAVKLYDDDYVATYTYLSSDYTSEPTEQTLKRMLRLRSGPFVTGINNIGVTAKFSIYGDTEMLKTVKGVLLDMLSVELSNTGNIRRESIEGYSIEYAQTETRNALSRLRYLFPRI